MPEYLWDGQTGILVPPGDDAALAEAIVSLLRDEPRRTGMKRAIERMKKDVLSWDGAAEGAMKIYRSFPGLGLG
jgi:glycosyltransferase involved in cell wall biosynthesis